MAVTGDILPDEPGLLLEFHEVYDTDPEDIERMHEAMISIRAYICRG